MWLILAAALCQDPMMWEPDVFEKEYAAAPIVAEHFDLIEIYHLRGWKGATPRRHFKFGRIMDDGSIGIVATHDDYSLSLYSGVREEYHADFTAAWYDAGYTVHRRCSCDAEHVRIYYLPDGEWPHWSPGQLITGFRKVDQ